MVDFGTETILCGRIVASQGVSVPNSSFNDDQIAQTPGKEIDADKLEHSYRAWSNLATAIGSAPSAREEVVWVARQAGTIREFFAMLNGACTTGTISFDLKKNGTTMLSATVDFTNADAAKSVKTGTFSGAQTYAAGDVLSIAVTVSSGDGTGPYACATVDEKH